MHCVFVCQFEHRLDHGIVIFMKHLLSQCLVNIVFHYLLIGFNKKLMANKLLAGLGGLPGRGTGSLGKKGERQSLPARHG